MRDFSGRKTFGFSLGDNFWFGSERSCQHLNNPRNIFLKSSASRKMWANATDARSEIPVIYRMFYIAHTSKIQFDIDVFNRSVIHIGLCMPYVCNYEDASELGAKVLVPITCNDSAILDKVSFEHTKVLELRNGFSKNFAVTLLR